MNILPVTTFGKIILIPTNIFVEQWNLLDTKILQISEKRFYLSRNLEGTKWMNARTDVTNRYTGY